MFVIFPFEQAFYRKHGVEVEYIGHPLKDMIAAHHPQEDFRAVNGLSERPIIALLPGSRQQEIKKMLGVMLSVVPNFEEYQFVIAGAPAVPDVFYQQILAAYPSQNIHFVSNRTYDLLSHATAALVTSGTATLETALFRVPQVVCYATHPLFYAIAKRIIRVPFISIVNIILNKPAVRELIQRDLNTPNLIEALQNVLTLHKRNEILHDYDQLANQLGNGNAALRAATMIRHWLISYQPINQSSINQSPIN